MARLHLVIHHLQGAHGVRLAVLVEAPEGPLAGDLGADGPVIAVWVERADGLACLARAAVPACGMMRPLMRALRPWRGLLSKAGVQGLVWGVHLQQSTLA